MTDIAHDLRPPTTGGSARTKRPLMALVLTTAAILFAGCGTPQRNELPPRLAELVEEYRIGKPPTEGAYARAMAGFRVYHRIDEVPAEYHALAAKSYRAGWQFGARGGGSVIGTLLVAPPDVTTRREYQIWDLWSACGVLAGAATVHGVPWDHVIEDLDDYWRSAE